MPFINNNDCRIYYETHGEGEPLVCLHGYGNCVQDWHSLGYVELLSPFFQLILIDGRGFGRSDKPHEKAAYQHDLVCKDTLAVINALDLEQVILLGYSMGGRNVFSLMANYPERFKRFIIGGMHPYGCDVDYGQFVAGKLEKGMQGLMDYFESGFQRFPASIRERYLQDNDAKAMIAAYANGWPDVSMKLNSVKQPTLLYAGNRDQYYQQVKQAVTLLPTGQLRTLENINHGQAFWESELASGLIKQFILNK